MKKMTKTVLTLVLAAVMTFSFAIHATVNMGASPMQVGGLTVDDFESTESFVMYLQFVDEWGLEFVLNHDRSLNMVHELFEAFPQNRAGEIQYPDYFGGVYIDGNGNLVFLMVEGAEPRSTTLMSLMRSDDMTGITLGTVAFSYRELWDTMYLLYDLIQDSPVANNVTGWTMRVSKNQVIVELMEYSEEQIRLFRTFVLDSPILAFEQSLGVLPMPAFDEQIADNIRYYDIFDVEETLFEPHSVRGYVPGDALYMLSGASLIRMGSIGFGARRPLGGVVQNGFITASHLGWGINGRPLQVGDVFFNSQREIIGTVRNSHPNLVDAAFVEFAPGSVLHGGSSRIHPNPEGAIVWGLGWASGPRSGPILGPSVEVIYVMTPIPLRVWARRVMFGSNPGDSGGAVRSTLNGVFGFHGIVVSGWPHGPSAFTEAATINTALGTVAQ